MKKKPKRYEPDPDIGQPCRICGAPFIHRITIKCAKCRHKTIIECDSPAMAVLHEDKVREAVCSKCGDPKPRVRRWNTHEHHHVSYRDDITVLVCYQCHQRMHGNAVISSHPFKKAYDKDIEPFIFAAFVTSLYVESLPAMREAEAEREVNRVVSVPARLSKLTH